MGAESRLSNVSVGHATRFTGVIEPGTRVLLPLCDMLVKPLGRSDLIFSPLVLEELRMYE